MAEPEKLTKDMKFRRALLHISKQLKASDVEQMKFLIAGLPEKPGFAELEDAKTGFDFFMPLVKNEDITAEDHYLLGYLLNEIGQKSLVRRFKEMMSDETSPAGDSSDQSVNASDQSQSSSMENSSGANPSSPSDSGISSPSMQTFTPNSSNPQMPLATSTPNSTKAWASVRHNVPKMSTTSNSPPSLTEVTSPPHISKHSPSPSPSLGPNASPNSGPNPSPSSVPNSGLSAGPSPDGSVSSGQTLAPSGKSTHNTNAQATNISTSHGGVLDTPKTSKLHATGSKPRGNSTNVVPPQQHKVSGNTKMRSDHPRQTLFTGNSRMPASQPVDSTDVPQATGNISPRYQSNQPLNSPSPQLPKANSKEANPALVKKQEYTNRKSTDIQNQELPRSNFAFNQLSPSQQEFMNKTQEGSFGFKTLTSVEVPGIGASPIIDLKRMPQPHPDDMGPPIESPSVSFGTASSQAQIPTEKSQNTAEPIATDGSSRPKMSADQKSYGLEEEMGNLIIQNQKQGVAGNPQVYPRSGQGGKPLADLETDAPDDDKEERQKTSYIHADEKLWFEIPPDQRHIVGSSSHAGVSSASLFPVDPSPGDSAVFEAFAPPNTQMPAQISQLGWPMPGSVPMSGSVCTSVSGSVPMPGSMPMPGSVSMSMQTTSTANPYGDRPEAHLPSSQSLWSTPVDTATSSRYEPSVGTVGGPAVRRKNMPMSMTKTSTRSSASSQMVTKPQQYLPSRQTQRSDFLGDTALVLSKPISQVSNAHNQSNRQKQRKQESPRKNDEYLEGLKRKVADSNARQPRPTGRNAPPSHDPSDDEPLERKTLRNYQAELATPAKSGDNFIICAPTGSGKTLTAASICRHFYDKSQQGGYPFKALFIVNIRHLTQQQTTAFRETMPVGTVGTIGETDMLRAVFINPEHAVIMVTAQILVNALNKTPYPDLHLQDISMIIFDECHHTTQDHPYNEIMKRYLKEKKTKLGSRREVGKSGPYLPHIIGLSASLGVGHGKDAYRHILTLCSNMDAKNVTQVYKHRDELAYYVNSPEQDAILYVAPRHAEKREIGEIIMDIMSQIEAELWESTPSHATQLYEQWVVERRKAAEINSDRNRFVASLYLYEYNRALLLYEDLRAIDTLRHIETFMKKRDVEHTLEPIELLCRELFRAEHTEMKRICDAESDSHNPKLEKLAKLLKQKFMDKPHSKGIVLTRMRLATMALIDFIRTTRILRGLPQPVKPIRLVGQGESDNFFMTESEQKKALDTFRNDESCNLLVATDIAQEGLDMPACNFVIRYNFVSNEIGTVQSKGRARAKQSECFLIVEEKSQNAIRELENRQKVINMEEAMINLNQLSEGKRLQEITKRQDEIYKAMEEKEQMKKVTRGIHNPEDVKILCKECNMYITSGQFMRKKGCHFTCIDPEIKKRINIIKYSRPQVYRDTQNVGNFKCGNRSCGQQLGVAVSFLDGTVISHRGYGFKVQSFLFKLPDESKMTFKQWKKATFDIPEL